MALQWTRFRENKKSIPSFKTFSSCNWLMKLFLEMGKRVSS